MKALNEAAPPEEGRAHAWGIAVIATLVMTVSYIDRQTLAVLAVTVCKDLEINNAMFGWITSAFSMAYMIGAPAAGYMIDRVGSRRGLTGAVLVWSGVAALHALVPTRAALFGLRILLGLAEAPSFPGAAQAMRRVLPKGDRSAGFGLLFTGSSFGAMIAAPLAIHLARASSWRLAFVGTALAGLAWIPLWILLTGTARARAAMDAKSEDAPVEKISLGAMLANRAIVRAMILVVASAPSIMFLLNWLGKYLAASFAVKQDDLAPYLWFPPLLFDLGAVGFGYLASRIDRARIAKGKPHRAYVGPVIIATVLSLMLAFVPSARDPMTASMIGSLSLAGGGALYALLTSDMMARIHPSLSARAGGLCAAAQSLAHIIAAPIVGKVVDATHSYTSVVVGLGLFVVPGAIVWIAWPIDRTPATA